MKLFENTQEEGGEQAFSDGLPIVVAYQIIYRVSKYKEQIEELFPDRLEDIKADVQMLKDAIKALKPEEKQGFRDFLSKTKEFFKKYVYNRLARF